MFFSKKYKCLGLISSFMVGNFIYFKKKHEKLHMTEINNTISDTDKNVFFNNLNPLINRPKVKIDDILLNNKKRISEYRQAAIFEDLSDLFNLTNQKVDISNDPNLRPNYLEEALYIGNQDEMPNRGYIQVNIGKLRRILANENQIDPYENKEEDEILLEDPINYFQKLLLFRIADSYFALGSFCSYCLTDLKEGAFLGDKLTCCNCLSEYYINDGTVESGMAVRNLASFPVYVREGKVFVRVPVEKIPIFSSPIIAEYNNELDPRHMILIGDTETVVGAINTLRLFFTGKISVITNKGDMNFIDMNKLTKSLFPLKAKHAKFFDHNDLKEMGINVYDERINYIDGEKRVIGLTNKMKIPYDKVLIAVGSEKDKIGGNYENVHNLQNLKDHAKLHNAIIKEDCKSVVVLGNNLKSVEIASSIRRYLDALGRENINIAIVSDKKNFIEEFCGPECLKIIQDYLKRNRVFIFRGQDIEFEQTFQKENLEIEDESENNDKNQNSLIQKIDFSKNENKKIQSLLIKGKKYVFKLPVDVLVYENGLAGSKCEFVNRIVVTKDYNKKIPLQYPNIFNPDDRMSLNEGIRYPNIFAGGNCSYVEARALYSSKLRTENVRTNYQMGFFSTIGMFEFHYPYDDVVVDNCKILDKNLYYLGCDPHSTYTKQIKYVNHEKNQFIVYNYNEEKLVGCFIFGFKKFHLYLREAMRYKLFPNTDFATKNSTILHRYITEAVFKKSDEIKCLRNFVLKNVNNISTTRYTIEDQNYTEDLMKRGLMAYNEMSKKLKVQEKQRTEEYEKMIREKNNSNNNQKTQQRENNKI